MVCEYHFPRCAPIETVKKKTATENFALTMKVTSRQDPSVRFFSVLFCLIFFFIIYFWKWPRCSGEWPCCWLMASSVAPCAGNKAGKKPIRRRHTMDAFSWSANSSTSFHIFIFFSFFLLHLVLRESNNQQRGSALFDVFFLVWP